jgi:hypothetical protein
LNRLLRPHARLFWLGDKLFSRRADWPRVWGWVSYHRHTLPLEWVWDQSLSALVLTLLVCATYR